MDAKTPLFPSAFDVKPPKGAEDWQSLYPYYTQFQPNRRTEDDQKFWFCDSQHWPTPLRPFDVIFLDFAIKCLGPVQHAVTCWCRPPMASITAS